MRINYNISSIIAQNALNNNDNRLSVSTQKLSSGYRINSASDDAAGLAIARKMNAQIKSLQRANRNANDGLSVVNTADGAMSEMHSILQRMNELSVQAANGTNADSDRKQIQIEIDELKQELDRIADTTEFNAQSLLDGSFAYKGYTNSENVKVMSYGEGVPAGTYKIDSLTYYHYDDITTYTDESKDTEKNERIEAKSADDIRDALVKTTTTDGEQPFPADSKVVLDDENIIISSVNNFEIKLTLNNRDYDVDGAKAGTTTSNTDVTTKTYKNVLINETSNTDIQYSISSLSIMEETGATPPTTIYTNSEEEGYNGLKDDLAEYFDSKHYGYDVDINSVDVETADGKITMNVTYTNPNDITETYTEDVEFKLYQETDGVGNVINEKTLDDTYLYSTTNTVKTQYTIDKIELDLTGMGPMIIQTGANEGQYLEIEIPALNAINLGLDDLDVSTEESATAAIDIVGDAINQLSAVRAKIGAYANRIEHTITNLDTTEENMTASYSRIMDVDMAEETTEYTSLQVLVQAATSVLAQANERPQEVLQLLQ